MQRFAQLYQALDASTATGDKVAALRRYFDSAPAADAAWAVYFLAGGKPRRAVPVALLRRAACRRAGVDDWLFEACYQAVGDLAETIALLLPGGPGRAGFGGPGLADWIGQCLLPLQGLGPEEQVERLIAAWDALDSTGRFLSVKLIGGGFRVGVSRLLVQRALAGHTGLDGGLLAQRLVGWTGARAQPGAEAWAALTAPADAGGGGAGQPYPFFLAHAWQAAPESLGPLAEWLVEWKYDGIRAQVLKRGGQVWIWSRGEELMTERFPEVAAQASSWPEGSVVDGELLVWPEGEAQPAGFHRLQPRIARKTVSRRLLAEAPVRLLAYDLLEADGIDLRSQPLQLRRERLEAFAQAQRLALSPLLEAADAAALVALRDSARSRAAEGLMLKPRGSRYGVGRSKAEGGWWKWKLDPLAVDAVLLYAQAGHGRRAGVYTDYTFAVWSRPPRDAAEAQAVVEAITRREPARAGALQLLPFAKAYSGLSDIEFAAVDRVVRASTLEKFGPVRSLRPSLVFEIGFEGIHPSPRHKSGIAVRFPRMLRPRPDKPLHEADSMAGLRALMAGAAAA
jgi:DNA ligase-1